MSADRTAALSGIQPKMIRIDGEAALKNVQDRRREHGAVLRRAADLAGYDHKTTAKEVQASESQLSAWYAGTENPQTWRFERHPVLGQKLLVAQAEARADHGVEIVTQIRIVARGRKGHA